MTPLKNTMFAVSERAGCTKRRLCAISLFLILVSCTDNSQKTTTEPKIDPFAIIPAQPFPIRPAPNSSPDDTNYMATMDKGLDLIQIEGERPERSTNLSDYWIILYDPKTHASYCTHNHMNAITNGITYDPNAAVYESRWNSFVFANSNFVYVGSLSPNQRVYVDTNTLEQVILTIDSNIRSPGYENDLLTPFFISDSYSYRNHAYLTNSKGDIFFDSPDGWTKVMLNKEAIKSIYQEAEEQRSNSLAY